MFRAVLLQIGATLITAAIAGLFVGTHGALSAALGGAACFIPNLLFVYYLRAIALKGAASCAATFFVGEFVKLALVVAALAAIHLLYSDVHWAWLLTGVIVTLQMNLFALLLKT